MTEHQPIRDLLMRHCRATPVKTGQTDEVTQVEWNLIRRAYGHHVQRANAWDLPLLPAVKFRQPVTIDVVTELAANVHQAFENVGAAARQPAEALTQANLAHHVDQAMEPDHGLTVIDEHHVTTDGQLARFTSAVAGGPVTNPDLPTGETGYEYVSPAVVNDRPAGWLRRRWTR